MKMLYVFLVIAVFSCDPEPEVKIEDQLVGHWEHSLTVRGSEQKLAPIGPESYEFFSDKAYIKLLGSFGWRDEGTWSFDESTDTISLTYRSYTNQVSAETSATLHIESIDEGKLILRSEFKQMNSNGEYVEFELIHYRKLSHH